jgi:hypothetical protein
MATSEKKEGETVDVEEVLEIEAAADETKSPPPLLRTTAWRHRTARSTTPRRLSRSSVRVPGLPPSSSLRFTVMLLPGTDYLSRH